MAVALLAVVGFRSRDPDSALYAAIAARLTAEPMSRWIAPEWWGLWGNQGLFREHPAGIFLLPALVARLGFPPLQAAYAVNAVYQILTIVLIQRLAGLYVGGLEARSLGWLLQLIPIALAYRIRANHEQAVLLCVLAALYGVARREVRWAALTVLATVGLLLVKGIFAVLAPACCAWLLLVTRAPDSGDAGSARRGWAGLALAVAAAVAVVATYETSYQQLTGESFLGPYLSQQLGLAARSRSDWGVAYKLYNLVWYLARVLWFAFPWSLLAGAAVWARRRGSKPRPGADDAPAPGGAGSSRSLWLGMGLAALYVLAFSLSDRKAERYIFPAYFFVGACGGVVALYRWPAFRRFAERLDRHHPLPTVAVWLGAFGASLLAAAWRLPRVKIWAPE